MAGLHLGRCGGRASPLRAKSLSSATRKTNRSQFNSVTLMVSTPVLHAVMPDKRNGHPTDEVPRRPSSFDWVTSSYKPHAKGLSHSSEARMVSSQPRPKGLQQHRSRCGPATGQEFIERLNHNVSVGSLWPMGLVSTAAKALNCPEGTSSFQPATLLRNRLFYIHQHRHRKAHKNQTKSE